MKTKIKLLLLLGLISVKVFSQNPESAGFQIPNFAAKSPEAAAFLKYGEYPVDLSTGLPNISIPLYTIEDGEINIPISLGYHASGIKVSQESSWVGLGWNLNYGAQIILSVRDDVDENNAQVDNIPSDATLNYYNEHPYMFNGGPIVSEQLDKSRVKDVYFFSSPTASGQFYIKNGVPIVYPPDAFKVSTPMLTFINGMSVSFEVTDPAGNVYLFATKEKSWRQQTHSAYYDSAWFVDRIITPDKQNINFVYEDDGVLEDYNISQEINIIRRIFFCGCRSDQGYREENTITPISTRGGTTYTFTKKIKEIIFDGGNSKVIFNRVNDRVDLKAGTVSGNMGSYSNSRLSTVEIRHKKNSSSTIFDFVKGYQFLYSYFNPTAIGSLAYRSKRLKLTQVLDLIDGDGHEFAYSDKVLPSKDSYSQDYYGYNNGANNVNLIPETEIAEPYRVTVGNANRGVNQFSIQAGMLTGIRYPTKGWTKFIYENNDYFKFAGYKSVLTTASEVMTGGYHPESSGILSFTQDFTITDLYDDSAVLKWSVRENALPEQEHLLSHQYLKVKIYKIVGEGPLLLVYETETRNGLPYVEQYENNIELLGNGNYRIVIERSGVNLSGSAILMYKKRVYVVDNPLGAGLRIASIENRDFDDALLSKKNYTYTMPSDNTKSSGKLINDYEVDFSIDNFKSFSNFGSCPDEDEMFTLAKVDYEFIQGYSSNNKYGGVSNSIIYQYVREQYITNWNNTTNGSTLYKFTTENDLQVYPTVMISTPWRRGKILEKTEFKAVGNNEYPVRKEVNTYMEDNSKVANISGFKMRRFTFVPLQENPADPSLPQSYVIALSDCYVPSRSNVTFLFYKYNFSVPWYYLKSTQITESFYNQANTLTGTLVTNKTYNYNNPLHMQLSSEVVTGAGATRETKYYYPHDAEVASEPGVANLKAKNRINTPLKTQTYEGSQKLSEQKTLYKDWGNGTLLPEIVQAAKGTGELENRIIYNAVDNTNGKPLEMQLANGTRVCYIWGYNKSVPVVKIENSPAYSSIPSNLITAIQTATNTGATDATIYTLMDNLRNSPSLAGSMVTTYTYIPLKGVSSITDAKGDRTTYSYDGQGRLLFVKDKLGRILSSNEYHYKP